MTNDIVAQEIQRKLVVIDDELADLYERQRETTARLEERRADRDALIRTLRTFMPDESLSTTPFATSAVGAGKSSLISIAIDLAKASGGSVKVKDLVKETTAAGFKSDSGGLHTMLTNSRHFQKSGPGEFRLVE